MKCNYLIDDIIVHSRYREFSAAARRKMSGRVSQSSVEHGALKIKLNKPRALVELRLRVGGRESG